MTNFAPRRDVHGISHINVVVDDTDQIIHRRNPKNRGASAMWRSRCRTPSRPTRSRFQQRAYEKRGLHIEILGQDHVPEELTPFPYKFFYWIDPWGVQWEMEQGVDRAVKGIVG
ncbi:MAG TPA: hypothetical protein VGL78_16465 [Solirubrobacteraceae bacterium]|jgi:hypothetical protein